MTTTYPDPHTDYHLPKETDGFTVEHLERRHAEVIDSIKSFARREMASLWSDFGDLGGNYEIEEFMNALDDPAADVLGTAIRQVEDK